MMDHKPISYGVKSQTEIDKLHDLTNQVEYELQTAIDLNKERNEQLNILLSRSDLLLHKNQVFGYGVMDYRKDIEQRKRSLNKIKYIAIGILLLIIIVLIVILNVILNQ